MRIHNELKKNIIDHRPGDINQALMDIGSLICKPKEALCLKCTLIDYCKGFISVDSCLNHFARSAGRKGVVIWGGTRWSQFGYKQNKNINYWFRDGEWNEEKFESQDPRNIMVEPEFVFEQFEKIYGKELIK